MKTKDTELINGFNNYISECAEDKDTTTIIFKRRIYLDDLNNYLRQNTQQVIDVGVGLLSSKIVIVLMEKNKAHIDFYRNLLIAKGIPLNDVYLTYWRKGKKPCDQEYNNILQKETVIFNDAIIINHSDVALPGNVRKINHKDFSYMIELLEKLRKSEILEDEKNTLNRLKQEYWQIVKEMFNYKSF